LKGSNAKQNIYKFHENLFKNKQMEKEEKQRLGHIHFFLSILFHFFVSHDITHRMYEVQLQV